MMRTGWITDFSSYKNKLSTLLVQEEDYWKHRAKTFWLNNGDGLAINDQQGLCNLAHDYLSDLFGYKHYSFDHVIDKFAPKISDDDNMLVTPHPLVKLILLSFRKQVILALCLILGLSLIAMSIIKLFPKSLLIGFPRLLAPAYMKSNLPSLLAALFLIMPSWPLKSFIT